MSFTSSMLRVFIAVLAVTSASSYGVVDRKTHVQYKAAEKEQYYEPHKEKGPYAQEYEPSYETYTKQYEKTYEAPEKYAAGYPKEYPVEGHVYVEAKSKHYVAPVTKEYKAPYEHVKKSYDEYDTGYPSKPVGSYSPDYKTKYVLNNDAAKKYWDTAKLEDGAVHHDKYQDASAYAKPAERYAGEVPRYEHVVNHYDASVKYGEPVYVDREYPKYPAAEGSYNHHDIPRYEHVVKPYSHSAEYGVGKVEHVEGGLAYSEKAKYDYKKEDVKKYVALPKYTKDDSAAAYPKYDRLTVKAEYTDYDYSAKPVEKKYERISKPAGY